MGNLKGVICSDLQQIYLVVLSIFLSKLVDHSLQWFYFIWLKVLRFVKDEKKEYRVVYALTQFV